MTFEQLALCALVFGNPNSPKHEITRQFKDLVGTDVAVTLTMIDDLLKLGIMTQTVDRTLALTYAGWGHCQAETKRLKPAVQLLFQD